MPTKPLEAILYRDLSKVAAKNIIEIASPLLQELVNYSTNALRRCETSTSGNKDEDLAVLMLYLHIIEMTDGIEVLVSQSCPAPAIPLVRSSFEALLSIKYILEADYVRRSLSWLVDYAHKRLAFYCEPMDPSTDRGKAFQKALGAHEYEAMQNLPLPPQAEVQEMITNWQDFLAKPHIQPIEAEFQRCKKERKRRPNWYQLFGGPGRSLYALAHHLKRGVDYEVLYRHWSSIAHAHDLSRFITGPTEGDSAIRRLRDPSEIKEATRHAALYILEATRLILGRFRPGEDIARWYTREVHQRFLIIRVSQ